MPVSQNAAGFTVVTPTTGSANPNDDTKFAYVSTTLGSDLYDGRAPYPLGGGVGPKATRFAARALLRPTFPDWLSFYSPDTYLPQNDGEWADSNGNPYGGRSAQEPMVVTTYGGDRRNIKRATILTGNRAYIKKSISSTPLQHLCVFGLNIYPNTWAAGGGTLYCIELTDAHSDILVEDCDLQSGSVGIGRGVNSSNTSTGTNVRVRRSIIRDQFKDNAFSIDAARGMTWDRVNGLVVEECLLDNLSNVLPGTNLGSNYLVYLGKLNTNVSFRRNFFTRSSLLGAYAMCGGEFKDNIFIQCPWAAQFGGLATELLAGGVTIDINGNCVIEGVNKPFSAGNAGLGFYLKNVLQGAMSDNLLMQNTGSAPVAFHMDGVNLGSAIKDVIAERNKVFGWGVNGQPTLQIDGASTNEIQNITLADWAIQEAALTSGQLIKLSSAAIQGECTTSGGRFNRGGSAATWFQIGGVDKSLAQWMSAVGDTTSAATDLSALWTARTIGGYSASIGLTGTTAAFIGYLLGQSKTTWSRRLMADQVLAYLRAGVAA